MISFAGREHGFATIGCERRAEHRQTLVVSGSKRTLPVHEQLSHRFACSERHPGLCVTQDVEIYEDALQFAKSLEAFVACHHVVHKFIRIFEPSLPDDDDAAARMERVVFVAASRARRTFSPQVLPLTMCGWDVPDDLEGKYKVSFPESRDRPGFEHASVWSLGKTFLQAKVVQVQVQVGSHEWLRHGDDARKCPVVQWPAEAEEIFPRFKKPPPVVKEVDDLMLLLEATKEKATSKPKSSKPKVPRMKCHVGNPDLEDGVVEGAVDPAAAAVDAAEAEVAGDEWSQSEVDGVDERRRRR